jgi:LCP family protein required for cell wall assembly
MLRAVIDPAPVIRRPSPFAAAALGLLFPGLGHLYAGRPMRALAYAAPAFLGLALLGGVLVSGLGRQSLVASAFSPDTLQAILLLDALVFLYRLAAIVDGYRVARELSLPPTKRGRRARAALQPLSVAGLAAVVLALGLGHAALARDDRIAYDTLTAITSTDGTVGLSGPSATPAGTAGAAAAAETPSPTSSGPTASATTSPSPVPSAIPWNGTGRLNVLIVGTDQRPPDPTFNTDTMIVASIDPTSGAIAMFSIPRDTVGVPLPASWPAAAQWGGVYPAKINSLWTKAVGSPGLFPFPDATRGPEALKGALGQLLGSPIRYYVSVNFAGFRSVIDTLGGVMIDVQIPVQDYSFPTDDGRGAIKLYVPPGFQLMSGEEALIYARARHQTNDFDRSQRQQRVIVSVRAQTDLLSLLDPNRLQAISDALRTSVHTDFPATQLPALISLLESVDTSNLRSTVFTPPVYQVECNDPSLACYYSLSPKVAAIQQAVRDAFTVDPALERSRQLLASENGRVWVLGGAGIAGQAGSISDYLDYLGVPALVPPVNGGRAPGPRHPTTVVTFYNGAEQRLPETARVLKATFGVPITTRTDPSVTVDVIVITGTHTPALVVPSG